MTTALDKYIRKYQLGCLKDEPLSGHSTWRIGGAAQVMVFPGSTEQISDLMGLAREIDMPWIVIGKGSNLLFSDCGFRGLVIKLDRPFSKVSIQDGVVTAQSGVSVPRLARMTGKAGLTGLEHAIGIPGSLGGLVAINGGSLRHTIGEVLKNVTVVTSEGMIETRTAGDCDFSYRHSNLLHSGHIIAEVTLELQQGHSRTILGHMRSILRERQDKFPLPLPNCGSVFTSRPELYHTLGPPGKLIEDLGLKGLTCGGVSISHKHANFMVNTGTATAEDVLDLVAQVREAIYTRHKILIETEVMYVHLDGLIEPLSAVSRNKQNLKPVNRC